MHNYSLIFITIRINQNIFEKTSKYLLTFVNIHKYVQLFVNIR